MCFNETASLVALAIGATFSAILLSKGEIAYGGGLLSISVIQLFEYYAHLSIATKNEWLNAVSTNLIFLTIALQPLALAFFNTCFMPKTAKFGLPQVWRSWPVVVAYVLIVAWTWHEVRDHMRSTYVDNECSTVCRLSWFDDAPRLPLIGFFVVYCLVIWAHYVRDQRLLFPKALPVPEAIPLLLIVSLVYTFFLDMEWRQKVGYFGSIWCFVSVLAGPMYLFQT